MGKSLVVCGLLACAGFVGVCHGQESQPMVLSLAECETLALQHNATVKEAALQLDVAQARQAQVSHARWLPEFTLRNVWGAIPRVRGVFTPTGVLVSPDTSTSLSDLRPFTEVNLDIVQPIFTFGKLKGLNRAAAAGVDAGEAQVARKEADVRLQIRELYWGVVLGKELLHVVEDALTEVTKAETRIQEELDRGSDEVSQNDLFKFQVFAYDIGKRHREALDGVELGRSALRAAIGLDETVVLDVETGYLEPLEVQVDSLRAYLAMAVASRPEITGLRAGLAVRRSLAGASQSDYFPQLFLGAQIKYNYAADRFDPRNPFLNNPTNFFRPGVVLGLNWNLNLVQTRDRVKLAHFDYAGLAQQESALLDGIRLEVEKAYREYQQARINVDASGAALKASDNWLRSAAQTFDMGIGEVKDFIDAFRANSGMRAEHLQAVFALNTSLARLSKAVGRDLYPN